MSDEGYRNDRRRTNLVRRLDAPVRPVYLEGMKSTATNPERTMTALAIIGPNLTAAQSKLGTFHVHAAGCADVTRKYPRVAAHEVWNVDLASKTDVIEAVYADQIAEDPENTVDNLASEFHFAPCCAALPFEAPASSETRPEESTMTSTTPAPTAAEKKAAKAAAAEAKRQDVLAAAEAKADREDAAKEAASETAAIADAGKSAHSDPDVTIVHTRSGDTPAPTKDEQSVAMFSAGKTVAEIARTIGTSQKKVMQALTAAGLDFSADKAAPRPASSTPRRKRGESTPKAPKATVRPEGFDKSVALFVRSTDTPGAFSFVGSWDVPAGQGKTVIDLAIKAKRVSESDRENCVFARTSCFWTLGK